MRDNPLVPSDRDDLRLAAELGRAPPQSAPGRLLAATDQLVEQFRSLVSYPSFFKDHIEGLL